METQQTIKEWQESTFPDSTLGGRSAKLKEEVAELIDELDRAAHIVNYDKSKTALEMADVVIVLYGLANLLGIDLHEAINEKMSINRKRLWVFTEQGNYRHQ